MSRHAGRAEHFRDASWLERGVDLLRAGRARRAPAPLRRLHEILLALMPGDHLVSTLPGGERVRLSPRYRYLSWNPEEYAAFKAAIRPGATVIDAGANIGAYTVLFAQWAGPSGRVIAFEPAPGALAGLREQLRLNGVADRVEVVDAALSDVVGDARFAADDTSGANALIADGAGGADGRAIDVRTTTIDAFCEERRLRPDLVKIDVEGAELDVLRGARRTLASGGVQAFVEFHPAIWQARGITRAEIEAELAAQRLVAEALDPSIDIWQTEGISARLRPL